MTVGEAVRQWRLNRKKARDVLSQEADLSRSYVSQLEAGRIKNPSLEALRGLTRALGLSSVDELLAGPPANDAESEAS